ncbi:MAG: DinB family protein [Bacilli bacterium]
MFYQIDDFVGEWKTEAEGTQKILNALTDESLAQEVAPGFRSLGRLAWHLVGTYGEMLPRTGLTFSGPTDHDPIPKTARAIADAYRQVGEAMIAAVQTGWTDETLAKTSMMYGEEWKNGVTLRILMQHEVHHRAQMTVLMRQAGLQVPGVYGPSKEEWAGFGMQAPEV